MNQRFAPALNVCGAILVSSLSFAPLASRANQQLILPPLQGVPLVAEYLVAGTGQGFAGLATYYMGQPVIFYDNIWVQRFGGVGSPKFRFLRAHEYAHHARGHGLIKLSSPPQMWPILGYQEELDADCEAVRYLKQVGDKEAVQAGYKIYQLELSPQDMGGRPGSVTRINIMNQC